MPPKNARRVPRQERARATVDAVLEATAQILVTEGYDTASTNRIAKRAGVSIGTLYQYFPNKHALVEELAQRHLSRLLTIATEPLIGAPELSIEDLTRKVVEGLVAAHQAEPELHRVLAEQAPVDVVERLRRMAEQALSFDMARRHEAGENRVTDAELSAFLVVTLIDESIRRAVQGRPELLADGRLVDEVTAMVTRYVLV